LSRPNCIRCSCQKGRIADCGASSQGLAALRDFDPASAKSVISAALAEERQVVSVANLTRADAAEFLSVAPRAGLRTQIVRYPLARVNTALADLREGRLQGAAVLLPEGG
jgi:D-arabinose 1-dehydrogenase-like Zn-dependent alcohol dehydrogenase